MPHKAYRSQTRAISLRRLERPASGVPPAPPYPAEPYLCADLK